MVISFIKISQFLLHLLSRVFTTIERFVRIIKDLRIQRIDWLNCAETYFNLSNFSLPDRV